MLAYSKTHGTVCVVNRTDVRGGEFLGFDRLSGDKIIPDGTTDESINYFELQDE